MRKQTLIALCLVAVAASSAFAADNDEDLAKKLTNPVADLISVPFQFNYDQGIGPTNEGQQYYMKFQPVVPISIGDGWNVISRTIIPFIDQHDMIGTTKQSGLGDTLQSVFLSPKEPTPHNWFWGAGPVFLLPTATDDLLGTEKFGLGPTAVLLRQTHGWTYGALVNHLWSVAGDGNRDDLSATYLQPVLDYTTKHHTTFGLGAESTYDWKQSQWTVPVLLHLGQLVKIGKLPMELKLSGKYYAEAPQGAPEWGLRFTITFLFPK
jgi:hypothetical protein